VAAPHVGRAVKEFPEVHARELRMMGWDKNGPILDDFLGAASTRREGVPLSKVGEIHCLDVNPVAAMTLTDFFLPACLSAGGVSTLTNERLSRQPNFARIVSLGDQFGLTTPNLAVMPKWQLLTPVPVFQP
jgi:hypothetical protein